MPKRIWKRVQPGHLNQAMEFCLEYAREKNNLSVEGVAALMGVNHWTLYKWLESGGMPVRLVKPFEHACGIDFVSRWLAMGGNKMVIDIPKGRGGNADDLMTLQEACLEAVSALIKFYNNKLALDETLAAIQNALERMAWHKVNVEKSSQPEIPFESFES